jgi:hypothetical protein
MLGVSEKANGLSNREAIPFDYAFGNRTAVRNLAGSNPALRKTGADVT